MTEDLRYKKAYELELNRFFVNRVRTGSLWGIFFYPLFGFLDRAVYPEYFGTFLLFRGIVEAVVIVGLVLVGTAWGKKHPLIIAVTQYLVLCSSIIAMIHMADGYKSPYYVGLILSLMFLLFIYPLSFRSNLVITVVVLAAYLGPTFFLRGIDDWSLFVANTAFFSGVLFFLNVSSFYANSMREQEFRSRYKLELVNAELKKLDVLKSQFFANVSHEVRTPLTSILGPVQSLYQGDVGALELEQQRMVGQIYRNSLKLLDMINQMLDFSKFEAGKMQLRLKPVDLDEVARDLVTVFEDVTERKGLKLRYAQDGDTRPVYLDPDKVERIVTNLIRNAVKFTETGSITVRAGSGPRTQWLEVRDTGIGIPAEHVPNLFKRFQQVDSSSTRKYEGTGLGLTIVKESVEHMHGTISVESQEGLGTTFHVELPDNLEELVPDAFIERRRVSERRRASAEFAEGERRRLSRRESDLARVTPEDLALIEREMLRLGDREERGTEGSTSGAAGVPGGGGQILLVEDNIDLRTYVGKMLTRFGHTVSTAIDGLDGWEHVLSHLPDLVVSDVMMPKMDGFELVRRIKSTEKTRRIPVILITAKPEVESKIQGLAIGADDYLPKPINIRELDARIRNLITTRDFQLALSREADLNARMEELSMSFSQSLEIRDYNTAGHSRDVLKLGSLIAEGLGIPVDRELRDSLLLHDIGKLGIPDRILLKESPLTDDEWQIMRRHPELGAELLRHFDSYRNIASIILAHQEHYDGTGYPNALKGDQIPLFARIIAIADAYHAMTNNRPYRRALPTEEAVVELTRHRGSQFDPKLVDTFVEALRRNGGSGLGQQSTAP